jgi:Brp/Blh family beta-carotene 15,15'-monooxygenase
MSTKTFGLDLVLALLTWCALLDLPLPWTALAIALMLGPGLAHGALDVCINASKWPRFSIGYVTAMLLSASIWWAYPPLGLAIFVLFAIWHFGEAELADRVAHRHRCLAFFSRGALLISWPLAIRLPEAAPVLEAMDLPAPRLALAVRWALASGMLAGHLIVLLRVMPRSAVARELLSVFAALGLMTALPLLEGFAIWFSVGHAGAHLQALRHRAPEGSTWRELLLPALPTWAIALGGTLALAWYLGSTGVDARGWAAAFLCLSVLTTPHMVVVARWHR